MRITAKITFITLLFVTLSIQKQKHSKTYKHALKVLEGFCAFIPSGNALVGRDTISVQSFYMSKTEISNFNYQEFLSALKRQGRIEDLKNAAIDTSLWNMPSGLDNKMKDYYHSHPAYRDYPVVNITKKGAELYCNWLTEMYDSLSGGEMKIKFRLPTEAEFIRAARGDHHMRRYPWGGPNLQNTQGQVLCNFLRLDATNIARTENGFEVKLIPNLAMSENVYNDILAPAKSYWPNEFGLYNMSGNVAEMLGDRDEVIGGDWRSPGYDVRIESKRPYKTAEPSTGFRVVATVIK